MTVSSTTTSVSYTGNGSTTEFAVTFPFYEIEVAEQTTAGVVTVKTEGTHYTVAGGDGSTGTVTMLVAPASGVTLRIRRATARTQAVDFIEGEAFPAAVNEEAHDRAVMLLQEIGQRINFNPTFGAQSGTLGSVTAGARYATLGDTTLFTVRATMVDIGTATGYLTMTLPVTYSGAGISGRGRNSTTGAQLIWTSISSTQISIVDEDGNAPATTGDVFIVSGVIL